MGTLNYKGIIGIHEEKRTREQVTDVVIFTKALTIIRRYYHSQHYGVTSIHLKSIS